MNREAGPLPAMLATALFVGALLGCARLAEPERPPANVSARSDLCRAAGKACMTDVSDARRKAKRARKAQRTRAAIRRAPAPTLASLPPTVMAGLPPVVQIDRAHADIPARALGADLLQPVPADYIVTAAFTATEPTGRSALLDAPLPWQHTAGGKAGILAVFGALIVSCFFIPGAARHG